jgi:cysteinyl-tRNA synthetase
VLTYFLTTHYRSPLEFSLEKLDEAKAAHERLVEAVRTASFRSDNPGSGPAHDASGLREVAQAARESFAAHMDDDLNTAAAIGELFGLAKELFRYVAAADAAGESVDVDVAEDVEDLLVDSLDALCIALPDDVMVARTPEAEYDGEVCATENVSLPAAARLAEEGRWDDLKMLYGERLTCDDASYACLLRDHYRTEKDFAAADRLRDELQAAGFEVRDTPAGTQVVPRG